MSIGEGAGAPGRWLALHGSTQLFPPQGQLRGVRSFQGLESDLSALVLEAGEETGEKKPLINCWGQWSVNIFFNKTPASFPALASKIKSKVHGTSILTGRQSNISKPV